MALMGAEAIGDAAIAYFKAYGAEKLASVQARPWAVSMDLTAPRVIRMTDPFRAHEPEFPVWYVMPEGGDLPTFKGGAKVQGVYRLVFAALVHHSGDLHPDHEGDDARTPSEMAGRLAMRHALAIAELLMDMSAGDVSTDYYANGQRVQWATNGSPIRMQYLRFDPSDKGDGLALAGVEAGATLSEVV